MSSTKPSTSCGGTIVRRLTFVGDRVIDGEITDGQDIRRITVQRRGDAETIQVDFSAGYDFTPITPGAPVGTAGHFTVTRNSHPNSIVVHVFGVRGFTAAQNLPDLSRMQLVGEIYMIVTLDDSAHRFVVTFKQPVTIEAYGTGSSSLAANSPPDVPSAGTSTQANSKSIMYYQALLRSATTAQRPSSTPGTHCSP